MKNIFNIILLSGLSVSTNAFSEPNYNTETGIVHFPRITVNESDVYMTHS